MTLQHVDAVTHFTQALLLPDADGRPSYVVHVAPLGRNTADSAFPLPGDSAPCAVVFMYDLAAVSVTTDTLSKIFDLTPAEGRAALQLLQGGTADTMAQRLGVSAATFKSQLQAAYNKSQTHRQVDLLKLLLSLSTS